jgi:hypothetical protein
MDIHESYKIKNKELFETAKSKYNESIGKNLT